MLLILVKWRRSSRSTGMEAVRVWGGGGGGEEGEKQKWGIVGKGSRRSKIFNKRRGFGRGDGGESKRERKMERKYNDVRKERRRGRGCKGIHLKTRHFSTKVARKSLTLHLYNQYRLSSQVEPLAEMFNKDWYQIQSNLKISKHHGRVKHECFKKTKHHQNTTNRKYQK